MRFVRIAYVFNVLWCNGSTTDFGSVCRGSNPRRTTAGTLGCTQPIGLGTPITLHITLLPFLFMYLFHTV